jgi:hypothetical protein
MIDIARGVREESSSFQVAKYSSFIDQTLYASVNSDMFAESYPSAIFYSAIKNACLPANRFSKRLYILFYEISRRFNFLNILLYVTGNDFYE